jgi:hypothetical protein
MMMLTTNVNPGTTFAPAIQASMQMPFFDTWSSVAGLYKDAMQVNTQQLLTSSSAIIQEHATRAFMEASKACAEALAKNMMVVQQQSLIRFADANQKAMGTIGRAFTAAWMGMAPRANG